VQNTPGATPGGAGLPIPAGNGLIPVYFTQYETELALTYDFDIWGKNKNALRSALGDVQAQTAENAFAYLELGMAIAKVYYQLQIDYQRRDNLKALVDNNRAFQQLTKELVSNNLNNMQSYHAASSNEISQQVQLLQIEADIAINECELKMLLASDFEEVFDPVDIAINTLPTVPMPCNLPLHLISRRPDVVSQLWLIESRGFEIDVARAGFYPDFNITAFLGYQTIHLHKLFEQKSTFFNVDPAFTLPIFDGGRLRANLAASEINYDLAIYKYNDLVLTAAKEVLQALALMKNSYDQHKEAVNIAKNQKELYVLTAQKVKHNISSTLDLLTAEENYLKSQDLTFVTLGQTIQAMLSLIRALGGGYDHG
jgi:NodT family efflux transporter outer membrane factor (OMF) lipoprotein